jgi:hypothetical protein
MSSRWCKQRDRTRDSNREHQSKCLLRIFVSLDRRWVMLGELVGDRHEAEGTYPRARKRSHMYCSRLADLLPVRRC